MNPSRIMIAITIRLTRDQSTVFRPFTSLPKELVARRSDTASPELHGNRRSPRRSNVSMKPSKTTVWTAAAAIAVTPRPNLTSMVPVTADVSPQPMALPNTMKPFRRPCSLTGVTSIAMPSTATSCVAANTLIRRPRAIRSPICSTGSSTRIRLKKDSVMPSCAPSTQGRRLPIAGNW